MVEVSSFDREQIRNKFCEIADDLRHRYDMTVQQARRYMKQLLDNAI